MPTHKLFFVGIALFFVFLLHTQQVLQSVLFAINWSGSLMVPMSPPYDDPWSWKHIGDTVGCDGIFSCAMKYCQIYEKTNVTGVAVRMASMQNCSTLYSKADDFQYITAYNVGTASVWLSYITVGFALAVALTTPSAYKRGWKLLNGILVVVTAVCLISSYATWIASEVKVYGLSGDTPPHFLIGYFIALNAIVIIWTVIHCAFVLAMSYNCCQPRYYQSIN